MAESLKDFLKRTDKDRWARALAIATMFVRQDTRFVGLDRLREPVAEAAAANALGGKFLPHQCCSKEIAGTSADTLIRDFVTAASEHVKAKLGERN